MNQLFPPSLNPDTIRFYKTIFQSLNFCSSRCLHIRLSTSLASEQKDKRLFFFFPTFGFSAFGSFHVKRVASIFVAALGLEFFPYSIAID